MKMIRSLAAVMVAVMLMVAVVSGWGLVVVGLAVLRVLWQQPSSHPGEG